MFSEYFNRFNLITTLPLCRISKSVKCVSIGSDIVLSPVRRESHYLNPIAADGCPGETMDEGIKALLLTCINFNPIMDK